MYAPQGRYKRFYDMNIWSPKKRDGKLNYTRDDPVKRGLVKHPGEGPWSSRRFFFRNDASILDMEKML
jgi:hypothetical protein